MIPTQLGSFFSVGDAREIGVTRGRLSAADLVAPFPGARATVPGSLAGLSIFDRRYAELLRTCHSYVPVAPAGFRFSHVTAALLYGILLPWRLERQSSLDVAVGLGSPAVRMRGVVGHRSTSLDPRMVDGMPVLAPEMVWLQLAPLLTLDELIVAGDHLVRRKHPASSLALLIAAVRRHGRARGIRNARSALEDIRAGADSPKESETRLVIVRAGLPEPVIGHAVHDVDGFFAGTPDLAYVQEMVALDYDGEVHRTNRQTFRDDVERHELFADADWRYIRITDDHLQQPHRLVNRVARALAVRAGYASRAGRE